MPQFAGYLEEAARCTIGSKLTVRHSSLSVSERRPLLGKSNKSPNDRDEGAKLTSQTDCLNVRFDY